MLVGDRPRKKRRRVRSPADSVCAARCPADVVSSKPICVICRFLPVPPVREPCRNCGGGLICLGCFEEYITKHDSKCLTCRQKVRLKRQKGGVQGLIDQSVWARIRAAFPEEVDARLAGRDFVDEAEERRQKEERMARLQLAQQGEIKAEFERQMKMREAARKEQQRREEEESERYIRQLAGSEPDLKLMEQKQEQEERDAEFARRLLAMEEEEERTRKEREKKDAALARKLSVRAEKQLNQRKLKAEKKEKKKEKKSTSKKRAGEEETAGSRAGSGSEFVERKPAEESGRFGKNVARSSSAVTPGKEKDNIVGQSSTSSKSSKKKKKKKLWLCTHCNEQNSCRWLRCQTCSMHYKDT